MAAPPKSGYSLWLSPTSSETVFTDLILSLSTRSQPPTIPFSPHATLFADSLIPAHYKLEDVLSATQKAVDALSTSVTKVVCNFEGLEAGKLFFQCVYIKLDKQGSDNLLSLHRALRSSFGDTSDSDGESYFPHMSLVYGDLPMEQKEALIASMGEKGEAKMLGGGREAVAGCTEFETSEILVVKTSGRSDEWEIVGKVQLGERGSGVSHQNL